MPTYAYSCHTCYNLWNEVRTLAARDQTAQCPRCKSFHTMKVPTTANFTVKGFSAKNGYSK